MVLEATMLCIDNSDYMRNGDFVPTRLQAQQDAVSLIAHSKRQSNPENTIGLMTLGHVEVLMTLCSDVGRFLCKLHQVQPTGSEIRFSTAIRIAHLALRHRQSRNQKMRIVVFVGSPVEEDEKDLIRLARRLKKEKVNVDVINFGEEELNESRLAVFVDTVNGKDGVGSHLVTVPAGSMLHDSLMTSAIVMGEDGSGTPSSGAGFEFGIDPNEDPELALALRVSMEEQRSRQESVARTSSGVSGLAESGLADTPLGSSEDALLQAALTEMASGAAAVSSRNDVGISGAPFHVNLANMTEDEQIEYALQISMVQGMDVDGSKPASDADEVEDMEDEAMNDPSFLASVLEQLPGVDPDAALGQLEMGEKAKKESEDKKEEK